MVQNTAQCLDLAVKIKYLLKLLDAGKYEGLASSELHEEKVLCCYCTTRLYPQTWKRRAMGTMLIYDLPPLKELEQPHSELPASCFSFIWGNRAP